MTPPGAWLCECGKTNPDIRDACRCGKPRFVPEPKPAKKAKAKVDPTQMQRDFERFHEANPDVYRELVSFARECRAEGATKLGLRMCWEHMRHRTKRYLKDERQSEYGMNDHYCPYYARLIMEQEPDLDGIFEVRRLRSADPITVDRNQRPVPRAA